MTVKLNVSALTRLAERERKAAVKAEVGAAEVVAKNAELLARIARVEAPMSDGSRGDNEHLRDTIGWGMIAAPGAAAALIGPEGEYGRRIGSFVEYGTDPHPIDPRPDGPGYLAWGPRSRVAPNPKTWPGSAAYSKDGEGPLSHVDHPGSEADPFMARSLAAVVPKFVKAIEALGAKSI